MYSLKRPELLYRCYDRADVIPDIELHDFITIHLANIFNGCADPDREIVCGFMNRRLQIAVIKCGVAESIAKAIKGGGTQFHVVVVGWLQVVVVDRKLSFRFGYRNG